MALALALGAGWLGFPGLLWDVAWHRRIGRDSFLSPPHVLMYTGVAVNGLVSAWAVFWGHRRYVAPGGLLAGGVGFLVAAAGAGRPAGGGRDLGPGRERSEPPPPPWPSR